MNFAKPGIREKVTQQVLSGQKRICLAISEPSAGYFTQFMSRSDVAAITTTAVKTPDGKHYIVNGTLNILIQEPRNGSLTVPKPITSPPQFELVKATGESQCS